MAKESQYSITVRYLSRISLHRRHLIRVSMHRADSNLTRRSSHYPLLLRLSTVAEEVCWEQRGGQTGSMIAGPFWAIQAALTNPSESF